MSSIKNDEFLNVVNTCLISAPELINKINTQEGFLDRILDIRSMHTKLSKELNEILEYPNYDLYEKHGMVNGKDHIHDLYVEIRNICRETGVQVVFTKEKTFEFKKRIFAYYSINGKDINGLIYYNKKIKKSVEKEDINNLNIE